MGKGEAERNFLLKQIHTKKSSMKKKYVYREIEIRGKNTLNKQGRQEKSKLHFKSKYCLQYREFERTTCGEKYFPGALGLLFQTSTLLVFLAFIAPSCGTPPSNSTGADKWGRESEQKSCRKPVPVTCCCSSLKETVIHPNLPIPRQAKISVFMFTLVKQLN